MRDPLKDPRFGDVFRFSPGAVPIVFLAIWRGDGPADWWGMRLDPDGEREPEPERYWQPLSSPSWTVVEAVE